MVGLKYAVCTLVKNTTTAWPQLLLNFRSFLFTFKYRKRCLQGYTVQRSSSHLVKGAPEFSKAATIKTEIEHDLSKAGDGSDLCVGELILQA